MRSEGSVFVYSVRGLVEGGEGFDGDDLCVNYCYTFGQDWELIAGLQEGISQITRQSQGPDRGFVWNFPLDVTFTSTNPYGWPQLVLNVYGKDFFGTDIVRGYSAVHLPLTPGQHTRRLSCFLPSSASLLQRLVSWLTGNTPEFLDPKMVAQARGREVTRVESQGHITVSLTVTMKDFAKLGYDCGGTSSDEGALATRALLAASIETPIRGAADGSGSSSAAEAKGKRRSSNHNSDETNSSNGRRYGETADEELRQRSDGGSAVGKSSAAGNDNVSRSGGLFVNYSNVNTDKSKGGGSSVVMVGGNKNVKIEDMPGTSGVAKPGNSSKSSHSRRSQSLKKVSSFDEDSEEEKEEEEEGEEGSNDSDDSIDLIDSRSPRTRATVHSAQDARRRSSEGISSSFERMSMTQRTDRSTARISEAGLNRQPPTAVRRNSGDTGVSFSKEHGVTFRSAEKDDEEPRNTHKRSSPTKKSSPTKAASKGNTSPQKDEMKSPRAAAWDSGRGSSGTSTFVDEVPSRDTFSGSRTRRKSSGVNPQQLDEGSSGVGRESGDAGGSGSRGNLFSAAPLPLPRTLAQQPLAARRPLPQIRR